MSDASCDVPSAACAVALQAAGLKHIGFGPLKKENQDEFFIQVGEFGGLPGSNLFCVFDGHGTFGKDAALYSRQLLPRLLDVELRKYFQVGGPAPARSRQCGDFRGQLWDACTRPSPMQLCTAHGQPVRSDLVSWHWQHTMAGGMLLHSHDQHRLWITYALA